MSKQDNQQPSRGQQAMILTQMSRSGPIPDAEQLEKYERITPGAADRIIKMAEKQSDHRQTIERAVIKTKSINSTLGVVFAFLLGAGTIFGGVFLAYNGQGWPGAVLGSAGLIGLVSVFIYGTKSTSNERIEKSRNK
jgi:uncharacterized membrane protein